MRKLILSVNLTLDGFMAGPDAELDWHFSSWNEEMAHLAYEQLNRSDTIVLGRITYESMARYWPYVTGDNTLAREDIAFAGMMNNHQKVVFSKTLRRCTWINTRVIRKNLESEIATLKSDGQKDMIIYGSRSIAVALMKSGLIDEYILWVHPVLLGRGIALFRDDCQKRALRLVSARTLASGVMLAIYKKAIEQVEV